MSTVSAWTKTRGGGAEQDEGDLTRSPTPCLTEISPLCPPATGQVGDGVVARRWDSGRVLLWASQLQRLTSLRAVMTMSQKLFVL